MEASIPAGNTEMVLYKYPLVGVGLVYMLPYLPKVGFSVAYMHLNEWHSAVASDEASEDRLVGTRLLLMQITGESQFFPVADQHPILLDVESTEAVCDMEGSVPPLSLRGF